MEEAGLITCEVLAQNKDGTYKVTRTDKEEETDGVALQNFWAPCPADLWEYAEQ